jgi:hypothetical protein
VSDCLAGCAVALAVYTELLRKRQVQTVVGARA